MKRKKQTIFINVNKKTKLITDYFSFVSPNQKQESSVSQKIEISKLNFKNYATQNFKKSTLSQISSTKNNDLEKQSSTFKKNYILTDVTNCNGHSFDLTITAGVPSYVTKNIVKSSVNNKNDLDESIAEYEFDNPEFGELAYNGAYSDYNASNLTIGKPHPYAVIESRSMSSIKSPENENFVLKLPKKLINKGILSIIQLEVVIQASKTFEKYLGDGKRTGFLLGDGAGVGKGRTVAGIIFENFFFGRKKSIWISISNDLLEDAIRDLTDIGKEINEEIPVKPLNKMPYTKIDSKENGKFSGVLFCTYASLISSSTCQRGGKKFFKRRLDQIIDWFEADYDGVIVIDESHKAKNLHGENQTKTGLMVKELQDKLQHARVIYCSATGATEPRHMAYMTRLGLWGPGSTFNNFDSFERTLTKHGVSAMELIAIEMKMKGVYLARQLSFHGVQFDIHEISVEKSTINGHEFRTIYDTCVDLWCRCFWEFKEAFRRNRFEAKIKNHFVAQFWGSHQRFFKYLCLSVKVEECVKVTRELIGKGKCVVIGLQSTGESCTNDAVESNSDYLAWGGFVSSAKELWTNLIESFYPSRKNLNRFKTKKKTKRPGEQESEIERETEKDGSVIETDSLNDEQLNGNSDSNFSEFGKNRDNKSDFASQNFQKSIENSLEIDEKIKTALLQSIKDIEKMIPFNMLDQLIHDLGGVDRVAEMTGRKRRMVMSPNGNVDYQSRRENGCALDKINILEKLRFNNGEKMIGIISDAASTGISLHSDRRFQNQLQRVHITLDLPWSADKAIQQFGRTHRSNQLIPPRYLFLISNMAGERRFAAAIAKRLESLGALTHGDRRCGDSKDLSQFNFDNRFGLYAVDKIIKSIHCNYNLPYSESLKRKFNDDTCALRDVLLKSLQSVDIVYKNKSSLPVPKFLNRIMGLKVDIQNGLFQCFLDIVASKEQEAMSKNEYDHGIRDVLRMDDRLILEESQSLKIKSNNNESIMIHKVKNIYLGVQWNDVLVRYQKNISENIFCVSKKDVGKILALAEYQQNDEFKLITPQFPAKKIDRSNLLKKFDRIDIEDAEQEWKRLYEESEMKCLHQINAGDCVKNMCTFGKRTKINYIITGAVFAAWKFIGTVYHNLKMEIIRVELDDGMKLIGALVYSGYYNLFIDVLKNYCDILPMEPRQKDIERRKSRSRNFIK